MASVEHASPGTRSPRSIVHKIKAYHRQHRGVVFVAPVIAIVLIIMLFPLVYSLAVSLFSWNLQAATLGWKYVGLDNYINAITSERFQLGLVRTVQITIPALTFEILFGLGLALLLNRKVPGRGLIVSLLSVPIMIAPAAVSMMWRLLLGIEYGGVNGFLEYVLHMNILPDWLGDADYAIWVIAALDVWQWTSFVMMILLAGLSNIPDELYEAAKVDGARAWSSFRFITIPLLRQPLLIVIVMRLLSLVRMFDKVFVLTEGGPGSSTETITFYTYIVGLRFLRIGDGAAMSLLIVVLSTILATIYFKIVPLQKEEASNAK